MMKIAIDCRYLLSGIGRYLEGLMDYIDFDKDEYYLLGKKEVLDKINKKFTPIYTELSPFSAKSLLKTPVKQINECDVFYTPNFIIPYGIKTKVYSTIHDVIFLDVKETCNGFVDKMIKKHLIKRSLKKCENIFTVSNFSKDRILANFNWYKKDITITYNGLSKGLLNSRIDVAKKEDYIVFVGNVKKHKGLMCLLDAIKETNIKLLIVGDKENFRTYDERIEKNLNNENVVFSGRVNDEKLIEIVSKAKFLIQPSTYEGFGLPPLEAIYMGTKPIISDIDVFKEIYEGLDVEFFKTNDSIDLLNKINTASISVNKDGIKKYSYENSWNTIYKIISE